MPRTIVTRSPRRAYDDEWSFSGRGRVVYQKTRLQPKTTLLEGDGAPKPGAPVEPGEPRG